MDFELHPTITLMPHTFNALVSPRELFIEMLNRNLDPYKFSNIFVCGNYSAILTHLHRRFEDLTKDADRIFYFAEAPRDAPRMQAKAFSKTKNQTTLGAF